MVTPGTGNEPVDIKLYAKRFWWNFVKSFGFIWLFIEPATNFIDALKPYGSMNYYAIVIISIISSYFLSRGKKQLDKSIAGNSSKIKIHIGDLLKQKTHIVIGTNDVFDTELGNVIKPTSIQGQFTQNLYNSDISRLNDEIESALRKKSVAGENDENKSDGKFIRYPVGTTLTLGNSHRYYLCAYSRMNNNLKCESNSDLLWHSLCELWEEVRLTGQGEPISIPVIGSDLARTGLSRLALIQMIVISFVSATNTQYVSSEINIVIHSGDVEKVDFIALEHFLESVDG